MTHGLLTRLNWNKAIEIGIILWIVDIQKYDHTCFNSLGCWMTRGLFTRLDWNML